MSSQINLLNRAFRKQKANFTLRTMLQSLVVILVCALILYAYALHQVSELDKQSEQGVRQLTEAQARLAALSSGYSPQKTNEVLQSEMQQLEKKANEASQLTDALSSGAVSNTTGFSEYMRALARQSVPGLWLTEFKVNVAGISLSGGAVTPELVPDYIKKLGHERVMQGKSFANLQMQAAKDAKYLEFTLYSTPDKEAR